MAAFGTAHSGGGGVCIIDIASKKVTQTFDVHEAIKPIEVHPG